MTVKMNNTKVSFQLDTSSNIIIIDKQPRNRISKSNLKKKKNDKFAKRISDKK